MPPLSPDQRQDLGDGVWRLMAALLQAWDVATDPDEPASLLLFSAVGGITESLLVELNSTGATVKGKIQEVQPVAEADSVEAIPLESAAGGQNLRCAIDSAVMKLEELMIQEHVAWSKRSADSTGDASAPSNVAAACAEALMADTVKILARCMELHPPRREDRPSGDLKAKMCAAVLRVVGRCTVAVEFRRSIEALQSGVFQIKLGCNAESTILIRLDAVWPAPSDLECSCFGLSKVQLVPVSVIGKLLHIWSRFQIRFIAYTIIGI